MTHAKYKFFKPLLYSALGALCFTGASLAAPPGDLPFGVYDPEGDFSDDKEVSIEHLFLPWEDVYLPSLPEADQYAVDRDRDILVTVEPWTWSKDDRTTGQQLYQGIQAGDYDGAMTAICKELGRFESPVTIRFAHEMDDTWGQFIWAGWNPEAYISSFRHVIDVCREQAPNLKVMWSPLGNERMATYYPGDDYVDAVGLSVFGLQDWDKAKFGAERSFDDIFAPRYQRALQFNKPIFVAELGYVGSQAYVQNWENRVRQVKARYPKLEGVVYFNQHEVHNWPDGFGLPDWRVKHQVVSAN